MLAILSFLALSFLMLEAYASALRGLAWAVDNRLAPALAVKPQIGWYYRKRRCPIVDRYT